MGKIGVYGGSFNPPHPGHIAAARAFTRELALDAILLVVAATPPHKKLSIGSPTAQTRLELARVAFADLAKAQVCDIELQREGESYTVDTLAALQSMYPSDALVLLMGTDMFMSFERWRDVGAICKMAEIAVACRAPTDRESEMTAQKKVLENAFGACISFVEHDIVECSSTQVRRMIFFQAADGLLDDSVLAEIRAHSLYGCGESHKSLPFERLREISLSLHDSKRVPHVQGCWQTAQALAKIYGQSETDAARAGVLHDVTKALDCASQLALCKRYGVKVTDFECKHYKLLHAKTAAAVAREIFGENEAVCNAIYWHTTGRANMSVLEKILYIADYCEPCRSFEGVEKMRELARTDLDAAMLMGFQMSIDQLNAEGKPLDQYSVQALEYLKKERNQL